MSRIFPFFKPTNDRPPNSPKPTDKTHGLDPASVRSTNEKILEVLLDEGAGRSGNDASTSSTVNRGE